VTQTYPTNAELNSGPGERAIIISSDGHATAPMKDYAAYIPAAYGEDFAAFCVEFEKVGARTTDPASLRNRMDEYLVEDWIETVIEPGRLEGQGDPHKRIKELNHEGIAGEVLFPDFGLPWELHPPLKAALIGYQRSAEKVEIANKAHNRWLADFCSEYPDRFGGLAVVSFADVEDTVAEIRWAKEHGLIGIALPSLDESTPFFHPRHDPIWAVLEELEMPVNSHTAISSISTHMATGTLMAVPHPACAVPMMTAQAFFSTQQILTHLIWGGTFERFPGLQLVMTEQGSGWVISALQSMDYTYEKSYLRRDVREVVRRKPSEYFARQCHMGSSLFSRAEAVARHEIGIDKIQIGMDYPHHEGTWGAGPGTLDWLRSTLGAAGATPEEARKMLGENAAKLWGFDLDKLRPVADEIGLKMDALLTPNDYDFFPRGDVHKPLATAF
jgi:predicted TIM-barrel fold metal-dependent hydrolase